MKLMLVEDHPLVAKLTVQLLRAKGHDVSHVATGEAALQAVGAIQPDLILIDLGLPTIDGFEVARRLRSDDQFKHTILIALSGYASEDDRVRSKEAGFDAHYAKPMNFDELPRLRDALCRRSASSPGVVP